MEYRSLGRSGVEVSALCLGTMMFGGPTSEEESRRIIADAAAEGVNFIDTADVYRDGDAERIVGRAIAGSRDRWIVASKVGNPMGPEHNCQGLSRRWMLQALEESLRRLGTDHLDIWYLHVEDLRTPLEETIEALAAAYNAGKIRYWGFSNFWGWQIAELVRLADAARLPRPLAAQPLYNATNRLAEVDYIPACAHFGIGVVPYSPLARGVLSGKYDPGKDPDPSSRAGRQDTRIMETEWRPESLEVAARLKDYAQERGTAPAHLALRWCLNNGSVSSIIAGPRTWDQWRSYVGALKLSFTAEDEAFFESLVPRGKASTPDYEDPKYPIAGRFPLTNPEKISGITP